MTPIISLQKLESKDLLKYVTKNICQISQAMNELFPCPNWVDLFSFSLRKWKSPSDIQPLVSRFALRKPVNCVIERNFVSGPFLDKTSWKFLVMNLTLHIAVSMTSFRTFDRVLMSTRAYIKNVNYSNMPPGRKAKHNAKYPGTPSVHRVARFFF